MTQPGTTPSPRTLPTPRTTSRSDDAPLGRPSPAPRYTPPTRDDSRPSGGTITRPSPGVGTPDRARPSPRPDAGELRQPGAPLDARYRPAPDASRPAPGRDRTPVGDSVKPGLVPKRPAGDAPSASTRYRPADTVGGVRPTPRPATSGLAPAPRGPSSRGPANTASPVLAAMEPRLGMPRTTSITSGVLATKSGYGTGSAHGYRNHCHPSWWYGYWDPWYCHRPYHWHTHSAWSIGIGCGSFGWSLSLWYPFWHYRSSYWDTCYHDAFWCGWSRPHCVSSSYWWYPSSVYCPTYLYVPSTVYVTSDEPAPAPAAAPAPEVVVAGGGVVGSARAVEVGGSSDGFAQTLAMKYVELGDFYFRSNRFRDAAEAYGKARSYVPDDASVHFVLADAVFADGDYHYAAFLIGEGLRLDPAMASADTDKRTFYADVKVFETQLAALDSYLAKAPYDAQAHFVRGYNLCFSGRPTEALAAFRRVLEIAPEHRGAQVFVGALEAKSAK